MSREQSLYIHRSAASFGCVQGCAKRLAHRGALVCVVALTSIFSGCSMLDTNSGSIGPTTRGVALVSYYGPGFAGRQTANGEIFDPSKYTAAHKSLPFNSQVRFKHPDSGRSVQVRINDRGPYIRGREFDVSEAAARKLGILDDGIKRLEYEIISAPRRSIPKP